MVFLYNQPTTRLNNFGREGSLVRFLQGDAHSHVLSTEHQVFEDERYP